MKRMSSDPAMRDAAFEHNRRMMDMAQLRYEGKQEGLAEGIEKGIEPVSYTHLHAGAAG